MALESASSTSTKCEVLWTESDRVDIFQILDDFSLEN